MAEPQQMGMRLVAFDVASGEAQFALMWIGMGLTCLMYAGLTAFGLHNFFKYIVKQQYQLKLLYVFAILATGTRLGRYAAMIINMILGRPVHTELSLLVDMGVSSLLVALGLCLALIMLKLYTYLQCWSIYLHHQRDAVYNRGDQLYETRLLQHKTSKRFEVLKYMLHAAMGLVIIVTGVQLALIYSFSEFAGQSSPMDVTALSFVQSQSGQAWVSFTSQRMVFFEQGACFLVNAVLLYTYIFFLVSIMNDLNTQRGVMYIESSSSMENEKNRLKLVLGLFGGSYILRSAFDLVIGMYLLEYLTLAEQYPGFFELSQCLYFVLADIVPIFAFFRMHH